MITQHIVGKFRSEYNEYIARERYASCHLRYPVHTMNSVEEALFI